MATIKQEQAAAGDGAAFLVGLAALARAVDETGAVARRAALLTRLASTMVSLSDGERGRLEQLVALFEGAAGGDERGAA